MNWIFSIKPKFANLILCGSKTVELRRGFVHVVSGDFLQIWSGSPVKAIVAEASVREVVTAPPDELPILVASLCDWCTDMLQDACVSQAVYDAYTKGAEFATAILINPVRDYSKPLTLKELRSEYRSDWQPPQSYRRMKKSEFEYIDKVLLLADGNNAKPGYLEDQQRL